ncbi:MAG: hypothetical protein WBM99_02240 [Psychromonas sp.]
MKLRKRLLIAPAVILPGLFALVLTSCKTMPEQQGIAGQSSIATEKDTENGLDENGNPVGMEVEIYTFATAPVSIERNEVSSFKLPNGDIHWYEPVFVAEKGINWVQAKALAEQAGGYLATITSEQENLFVFNLIKDKKYWFQWDHTHNYVMNGPFLGGFQPMGDFANDQNWKWVTGEEFTYEDWCHDGDDGDEDPRPNDQPNDATGNQNVLAYGELNKPVPSWGDFPHMLSSYNDVHDGKSHGFIIEYEAKPIK